MYILASCGCRSGVASLLTLYFFGNPRKVERRGTLSKSIEGSSRKNG